MRQYVRLAGTDRLNSRKFNPLSGCSNKPQVTEVRHYVTICRVCGKRVKSHFERRRSNAVVYDASVKGLVVYLSTVQFLPYNRIASFFKEVFGLVISQGSMVNWINEAKRLRLLPLRKSRSI